MKISGKLLSSNKENLLFKNVGECISYIDFPELYNSILNDFKIELMQNIQVDEIILKNVVENISRQIFEVAKAPILYTFNQFYFKPNTVKLTFNRKDLLQKCYTKYPELSRIIEIQIRQYCIYFSNLIKRLYDDEVDIKKQFEISGSVISFTWPLGDFHNGGETHIIINYSCGNRVIYKVKNPKGNLAIENLILSITQKGHKIPYLFPKRLIKDSYYWEEFIKHKPSDSKDLQISFYKAIGNYLAVFYILGISDIISDNIISNSGTPVFIDIECLLKPTIKTSDKDIFPSADNFLKESVVGTGLLPFWTSIRANEAGTNFGGISNSKLYTQETYLYVATNGKIAYDYKKTEKSPSHLPYINQHLSTKTTYDCISSGFTETCCFLKDEKNWLGDYVNKLIEKYKINSRVLLRHTSVYETILKESIHPDYLISGNERSNFLNCLNDTFDRICFPRGIIELEKEQLKNFNIPIFYAKPLECTIFSNNSIFDIIEFNGFESMLKRLNNLSSIVIKKQNSLIEKSIACFEKITSTDSKIEKNAIKFYPAKECENQKNYVQNYVIKLADKLIEDSIWIDNSYQWIDISVGRVGQWEIAPKNPGIYDGIDGLGLFYLYLYDTTKIERYKNISKILLDKSLFAFNHFDISKSYHLFSPLNYPFSILFFLWHYQSITKDYEVEIDKLFENKLVPFVTAHIESDTHLDFANGCSALLCLLVDYYNEYSTKSLENTIHLIAKKIIKSAIQTPCGITWGNQKFKKLVGFAHGNAGFLYSLSKYYKIFGINKDGLILTNDIIRYIQHNYSTDNLGWKDLRYQEDSIALPSWCHGSSGILIAYLETQNNLPVKLDIDWTGISEQIFKKGFDSLHCICHGMTGNAEILHRISGFINNSSFSTRANDKLLIEIEKNFNEFNWKTGFTNGKFSLNGLFLGTSGIGYNLLKIFVNPKMPSLLTLDPPESNKANRP